MRILLIITTFALLLFASCADMDNYTEAKGSISGGIYDIETKGSAEPKLVPAQAPNGARVRLYEEGALQPVNFWVKPDGTFTNNKVFSGKYTIMVEGPFITQASDALVENIPAGKELQFFVEPYMRINASAKLNTSDIEIKFKMSKSTKWNGVLNRYVIIYSNTHSPDVTGFKYRKEVVVESADEASVLDTEHVFVLSEKDANGAVQYDTNKPIFVRVAARTTGTEFYNYSEVIQLK